MQVFEVHWAYCYLTTRRMLCVSRKKNVLCVFGFNIDYANTLFPMHHYLVLNASITPIRESGYMN